MYVMNSITRFQTYSLKVVKETTIISGLFDPILHSAPFLGLKKKLVISVTLLYKQL